MAKTYEDLIPRKQAFVDYYLKTGDRDEAYLLAGYTPSKKSHKANAYKLYRELTSIIEAQVEKKIGKGAIRALNVIEELMTSATSESVKLNAAKDILHLGGYDKPIESKITIDDTRTKDNGVLLDEIEALLYKARESGSS